MRDRERVFELRKNMIDDWRSRGLAILKWWKALFLIIKGCIGLFLILAGVITLAIAKE